MTDEPDRGADSFDSAFRLPSSSLTPEAVLAESFRDEPQQAITLCEWVTYTARYLAQLDEVPMPLSYTEWRAMIGYEPGVWGWDGEQVLRAAFYAAQPGCCA